MLNFTVDKTKTMYAAIHTRRDTASAKHKTPHSTQHYCVPPKVMKTVQLLLCILFRMSPLLLQTWAFKKGFYPEEPVLCLPPRFFSQTNKWSSSTTTTLPSSFFIRKKTQTPHFSSLSSSSLNLRLILLRIRVYQICIYQQSLSMFPLTKRDGL